MHASRLVAVVIPGECVLCDVTSIDWQTLNRRVGLTAGLNSTPIEYDVDTHVQENFFGHQVGACINPGSGFDSDVTNVSSAFDPSAPESRIGINLALDANVEFGTTVEWSAIRNFFGLESLSTGVRLSVRNHMI